MVPLVDFAPSFPTQNAGAIDQDDPPDRRFPSRFQKGECALLEPEQGVARAVGSEPHRNGQVGFDRLENGPEKVRLVLEMVVHRTCRYPSRRSDGGRADSRIAGPAEESAAGHHQRHGGRLPALLLGATH